VSLRLKRGRTLSRWFWRGYRRRTYLHRSVSHLAALLQFEPKAIEATHNWSGPDTSNLTRVISAAGGDDSLGIAECWIRHEEMEA
jgi:hypothetical protein